MNRWKLRWLEERDRRYSEVNTEREKALRIKERADAEALDLARTIQTYKDEKANELRSQIERERGGYASKEYVERVASKAHDEMIAAVGKIEATLEPLITFVTSQQGRSTGLSQWFGYIGVLIGLAVALYGMTH